MSKKVLKYKKCNCGTNRAAEIEIFNKLVQLRVVNFFIELIRQYILKDLITYLHKNVLLLFIKKMIELILSL